MLRRTRTIVLSSSTIIAPVARAAGHAPSIAVLTGVFRSALVAFVLSALALVFLPQQSKAQEGSLYGTVTDGQNGESLIGANVLIVELSKGAKTDIDGKYIIRGVKSGSYTVRISYVGYTQQSMTGVQIEGSRHMDIVLAEAVVQQQEVVVEATRQTNTEASVLGARRRANTIGDGFSAEQVKLTPDASTGDALRRVTGITLVDNKFIFVRGVTDRYNSAMLNGVALSSTDNDADKKSFSFDMIPANLIENTVVTKTSTPDLPGDFTGGLVQMNTLEFPDHPVVKLSISTSYNELSSLRNVNMSQSGGRDWLGMDDGTRDFPSGKLNQFELGKALPNTWAQKSAHAPMGLSLGLSAGDRFFLGDDQLGYVGALSYRNGIGRTEIRNKYAPGGAAIAVGGGTQDVFSTTWGGMLNLNYKFLSSNKLSLRSNFNQSGTDKVSSTRVLDNNSVVRDMHVSKWNERSLFVTQLQGEHRIDNFFSGLNITWRGTYSSSIAAEPDRKTYLYAKNDGASDSELRLIYADRAWSDLREFTRGASVDFDLPSPSFKIKAGGLYEKKFRTFDIRYFASELDRNSTAYDLLFLPIENIFSSENYGSGKFSMSELSSAADIYNGESELLSAYAMTEVPFVIAAQSFRISGGARMENFMQHVRTVNPDDNGSLYVALIRNVDILPSVNLLYQVNSVTNLRLAYGQSVNRPEFREMASYTFYDYSIYEGTIGNPKLARALSRNYDARLELFPDVGEVVAVSYFYKSLTSPIELIVLPGSNPVRTWSNAGKGSNRGFEIELRKSFGFLGGYGANISLTGNYTRIYSAIDYTHNYKVDMGGGSYQDRSEIRTREMQGQSPYMVNVSLLFREPSLGTSFNLLYNAFGARLYAVGSVRETDVYEDAHGVLDCSITQPLFSRLEMKVSARDIAAKTHRFTIRNGEEYRELRTSTTYSLQFGYSF